MVTGAMQYLLPVVTVLLVRVSGQGAVQRGSFTTEFFFEPSLVEEAPHDCDEMLTCAGVTYRLEDSLEVDIPLKLSHNSKKNSSDWEEHWYQFPFEDEEDEEDSFEQESSVFFHAFLPPFQEGNNHTNMPKDETWVTYRSKKPFVLHPGKIVPGTSSSYTLNNVSIEVAKQECQSNRQCVGFSFPVHSSNLLLLEKVTFATSLWSIEDDESDQWRTYLSNDEKRVTSVSSLSLDVKEDETGLYQSCCKTANDNSRTIPSIEEVKAMDDLERIPCNLSRSEFFEKYELQRRPVILVGCDDGWLAHERWTHKALIPRFDNASTWRASVNNAQEKGNTTWQQIVDAMSEGEHFYIFDQLELPHQKTLDEDYEIPIPFQYIDLYKGLNFPRDYGFMKWFCLGSRHSGTFPHSDPHSTDAWNTVIYGHKWWILYPEGVEEEEVECSDACSIEDATEVDWYASVGINAARSEYGSEGWRPLHILQKPGETIYVPFGIVHSVLNMDDTAAITSNYGAPGNLEAVWEYIVEEGNDKHWMKLYYGGVLDQEQRRIVRDSAFWPPWERYDDEELFDEYEDPEVNEEMRELEETFFSFREEDH